MREAYGHFVLIFNARFVMFLIGCHLESGFCCPQYEGKDTGEQNML